MGQADRTMTLLSRLSGGAVDRESVVHLLAPASVVVSLSGATAAEPQAQLLFTFAVNLMARLYPVVQELQVIVPSGVHMAVPIPRWSAATLDEHLREIDRALQDALENWHLSRLSSIDRGILRLAAAEMLFLDGIPPKVSIQEGIRLAEQYGGQDSPRFVNGVLDALYKRRLGRRV